MDLTKKSKMMQRQIQHQHPLRRALCLAAIGVGLVCGLVSTAVQSPEASAQGKRAPKVIELDDGVIKGKVQKPEAFYILQHASLNYKRLDPRESFIPELVKSVEEKPF